MPRRDFTKVPFAATGDVTSIPTAVQPDGSVSMTTGYGFDYQRDNGSGGGTPDPLAKSIPRDATNGILNEITASIGEIQFNGLAIWAASAAPYPINATVRHNNTNWRSTVANNSAQPGVAPLANWIDTTAQIAQATESVAGIAKIATGGQVIAGLDDTSIVTSKKLAALKTASKIDMTAGRLVQPGDYGWGAESAPAIANANTWTVTGSFQVGASWTGSIYPGTDARNQGSLLHQSGFINNTNCTQIFTSIVSDEVWFRRKSTGVMAAWVLLRLPIATQSQVNEGVEDAVAITPLKLEGRLSWIQSPEQVIAAGGLLTIPHGLGFAPAEFTVQLVCKTADRAWLPTDPPVNIGLYIVSGSLPSGYGAVGWADSTNIYVRFGVNGVLIMQKDNGQVNTITPSRWRLVVKWKRDK